MCLQWKVVGHVLDKRANINICHDSSNTCDVLHQTLHRHVCLCNVLDKINVCNFHGNFVKSVLFSCDETGDRDEEGLAKVILSS